MKSRARRRGLALPAALVLLTLLALALAAAQRAAAMQWRSAQWRGAQLQAREDAWAALGAARDGLAAQGWPLAPQDCHTQARLAQARPCAGPPGAPGDVSWTRLQRGSSPCTQACAWHVQVLDAPAADPSAATVPTLRITAYAGRTPEQAEAMVQLDLDLLRRGDSVPRPRVRTWRVLR